MTPWPRDAYTAALWESGTLKPLERLVALAYADHARDQDSAFVTYDRLKARTGLSRDAIARAIAGLVAGGWLELKDAARQHYSARYWLRIPGQQSVSQTAEPQRSVSRTPEQSVSRTPDEPSSPSPVTSSPPDVTSSPPDGLDYSADHPADLSPRQSLPADQAAAVAALLARFGNQLDEDTAIAAVQAKASRASTNLTGYLSRFTLEDVRAAAGDRRRVRPVVEKCEHGQAGGRDIKGRGDAASRVCGACESADPASAERLVGEAS